jgi:NAD(P)-dependent dehydrogenase (short-subunit alcohol dehydrogenase family)
MGTLDGRVAIVTGGGRGIGQAVSKLLAAEGAGVVINDLGVELDGTGGDSGPAHQTADEILASGGQAVANGGDISDTATGQALVEQAVSTYGKLDVVVNVAGILRDRMIFNLEPEDWDAVIKVHLRGTYSTVRPASAYWREKRNPDGHYRIINFTSASGLHGSAGQPNYASAKMGIVGLTYSLANALARLGVTANAISPGAQTRMTATAATPDGLQDVTSENVAPIVAYIASEHSDWLSGRTISALGLHLGLYNNPEEIAEVNAEGKWDLEDLRRKVESTFRPLADGLPPKPKI